MPYKVDDISLADLEKTDLISHRAINICKINRLNGLNDIISFYRPGPAPRALAYMALSAYEACLGGMPDYQSLRYRLVISGLPEIKKDLYWPE